VIRVFAENESAVLEVADAGKGMPTSALGSDQKGICNLGVGLRGMNERLRGVGGKLELTSVGQGTTVRATTPCVVPPTEEAKAVTNLRVSGDW
jgi:signal transduction histidine kinase